MADAQKMAIEREKKKTVQIKFIENDEILKMSKWIYVRIA